MANPHSRAQVEAEIERLIALLDHLDGDSDLEPWLAERGYSDGDDREGGDVLDEGEDLREDDEDNGDAEPSMGWPAPTAMGRMPVPDGWSYGRGRGDAED